MGTEDVQARASVFCTEERHARVEVEQIQEVKKVRRRTPAVEATA